MANPFILKFKPEISLVEDPDTGAVLTTSQTRLNLSHLSPSLLASLRSLSQDGATEAELSQGVMQAGGFAELPKFYFFLTKFVRLGSICYLLHDDPAPPNSAHPDPAHPDSAHPDSTHPAPFATLIPTTRGVSFEPLVFEAIALDQPYQLSRLAYCHAVDQRMLLESPTAPAQIELGDWRGGAIATALAQGTTAQALLDQIPGLAPELVQGFLSLLQSVGLIAPLIASESGAAESEALRQWEFHDLLFHARSRQGRTPQTVGSTYRFRGEIEPLPVVKPQPDAWEKIVLPVPDLAAIAQRDRPFTEVLETRRSIRTYNAAAPITLAQLGEFLYRSARLRQVFQMEQMDCSDRPFPAAGACNELDLYIAVYQCEGLAQGLYHYCSQHHRLGRVQGWNPELEKLMLDANHATRRDGAVPPQVLMVVASRFARLAWKYEAIAYALMLKNLGCLYQTMYLVATSMGLAPCGVGTGNADLFSQLIGSEYYAETSIGEFALGSAPESLADE